VLFDGLRMPVDTQRKMQIDPKGVTFESSHVRRVAMPVFLQNTRMFSKYASIGRGPDGIGSISMKTSLGTSQESPQIRASHSNLPTR
jgi:hypothetical protein